MAATLIYPDARPVIPGEVNENLKPFLAIHKDVFELATPNDVNLDQVDTLIVVTPIPGAAGPRAGRSQGKAGS